MLPILLLGASASLASAACTRPLLERAAATYLQAQAAGNPSLLPFSPSGLKSYSENDRPLDPSKSVLATPITADFSRSFYDVQQCATFTELTAANSSHPYVIHTRILLTDDAASFAAMESVVTDDGDWVFNATGHLYWTMQENWDPIPAEKRDSRAVIQAAADAYLDQWGNVSHPVPLGTPCARLEGGFYSSQRNLSANTCLMGAFPQPLSVGGRRYIIDEEYGVVDIFNGFPWLDQALGPDGETPSSNLFRVQEGLIRYIHEITVCSTRMCGL